MDLHIAHFLVCRGLWFDHLKPHLGFGLGSVLAHIEPLEGHDFPIRIEYLYVYLQFWGDVGEYRFRIRLVRIETEGYDGEVEIPLGIDGSHRDYLWHSQRDFEVTGLNYVDEVGYPIGPIPIEEPGLYEFQAFIEGSDEPAARERILARR